MKTWRGYYSIWPCEISFGEEVHVTLPDAATEEEIGKAIRDEIDLVWSLDDMDEDEPHWRQNKETGRWETETGNCYPIGFEHFTEVLPITVYTKDPTTTVENLPQNYSVEIKSGGLADVVRSRLRRYLPALAEPMRRALQEGFCMMRCVPTPESLYAIGVGYVTVPNIGSVSRAAILDGLYKTWTPTHLYTALWLWDSEMEKQGETVHG